ncbi:MAG: DUF134 domain-containing protein [Fimbriimonadales bacterium]
MPRRKGCRRIGEEAPWSVFRPDGCACDDQAVVVLALDELEALRLCDRDGMYQDDAARLIGVSRPTLGRMLEDARRKVATALSLGRTIRIEEVTPVQREQRRFVCARCSATFEVPFGTGRPEGCPQCGSAAVYREGCRRRGGEGAQAHGRCGYGAGPSNRGRGCCRGGGRRRQRASAQEPTAGNADA